MKKILLSVFLLLSVMNIYGVDIQVRNKEVLEDRENISNQIFRTITVQLQEKTLKFNQVIARSGNRILCITYNGETPDTNNYMWITYKENDTYGLIDGETAGYKIFNKENKIEGIHRSISSKGFLGILVTGDQYGMDVFYVSKTPVTSNSASSVAYRGAIGSYAEFDRSSMYPTYFAGFGVKITYNNYQKYQGLGYIPKEVRIMKKNGDSNTIGIISKTRAISIDFDKWFTLIDNLRKNEEPN